MIPADPASGLAKDLTLYENAMVIPGTTAAQQNPAKLAFLQVPDMIQLGATWKFIELPHAIDPEKPIVATVSGIRSMLFDKDNDVQPRDEAVDAALKALADYDIKNAPLLQTGEKEKIAQVPRRPRAALAAVVKASKNPDEQLGYNKQVVDSLVAALRTGLYPQGKKPLETTIADGGKLGSYAAYSMIDAEFAMSNDEAGRQHPRQPEKMDGRPRRVPEEVPQLRRGAAGLAPPGQRQRVQRRGEEGAGAVRQAGRRATPRPTPARKRRARCAGSTWRASRSPSREPACKTRRSIRRSISASRS